MITIPYNTRIQWSCVKVPRETPYGITDGHCLQCVINGARYHLLDKDPDDGLDYREGYFIDVESGEIVQLHFEGY